MQRKFVTNLALILALNLLIKPFWIVGIDVMVQNSVGIEQYGFYYAIFNFSFLLNIILDLGITNFNITNISQNNHLLNKHLSSIIFLRIILAITYAIITIAGGFIIGYTNDMMKMLAAVIFNQALLAFILYLRSNLVGLLLFKTDGFISVIDRFIMIILCGLLLYHYKEPGSLDIRLFIYAQTVAYIITAVIVLFIVLRKAKILRLQWRWPFFIMILKKSYPYAILILLMTFNNKIDGVMLERILPFRVGAQEAGIYASAYRLLDASNQIPLLFAYMLLPIFAKMLKLKQDVEEMVVLSFSLLVIPAIIVAICSSFYSIDLMNLLYKGNHTVESANVFRVIIFCFVAISSSYIFGTLLTSNGNLRQLNIMAGTSMVINIGLNLILIPRYTAVGAAFAAIISQFLTAIAQILISKKTFDFHINYKLISTLIIFIVSIIFINKYISGLQYKWVVRFLLSFSTCFLLAIAAKLISPRNIYRIVKYGD